MKPIIKKINLIVYIQKIENQKENLKHSLLFDESDKTKIATIYDELIKIAWDNLAKEFALKSATTT